MLCGKHGVYGTEQLSRSVAVLGRNVDRRTVKVQSCCYPTAANVVGGHSVAQTDVSHAPGVTPLAARERYRL